MGNCLDVPEPKDKRKHREHRGHRLSVNPVAVAAPPEFLPVVPEEYYPHHPHLYQYPPEMTAGHMVPSLPPGHVLMVDQLGREYYVPMADPAYHEPQYVMYYADYTDPEVFYGNMANGVKHKPSRRHREAHHVVDEEGMGEARAMRKKSREERKSSHGHDDDKVDIRDAATFSTTAIVTATTPTVAAAATTTTVAAAAAMSTQSNHADHVTGDHQMSAETSKFERYLPTPPPTPPAQKAIPSTPPSATLPPPPDVSVYQTDEKKDNDETDHCMAHPPSVSFDQEPALVIPQSKFKIPDEKNDDGDEDLPRVVTSKGVVPPIVFQRPARSVDVVITYSILARLESDIVRRLSSLLESSGISVWAERLGDSSRARKSDATAKAILGSKVVVVILSEGSCHQRFIRDHVALATVINAPIYPVTTQPPRDVLEAMPVELKLQLQNDPEQWTEIGDNNEYSFLFNLRSLARSVQEDVEYLRERDDKIDVQPNTKRLKRRHSLVHNLKPDVFWDVHFGHRHSVKWERLQKTIQQEFDGQLKSLVDVESLPPLLGGLKKKTCDDHDSNTVTKDRFTALCHHDGEDIDVWEAILKVARTEQAVRDVFDTESTVRHLVLENAGEMM